MLEFVLRFFLEMFAGMGLLFVATGLLKRRLEAPSKDGMIFSDGFQGSTVAALLALAVVVYNLEDPRSLKFLKENAALVILVCLLGASQQMYSFRRSL